MHFKKLPYLRYYLNTYPPLPILCQVKTALSSMEESLDHLQQGRLEDAYLASRNAIKASGQSRAV